MSTTKYKKLHQTWNDLEDMKHVYEYFFLGQKVLSQSKQEKEITHNRPVKLVHEKHYEVANFIPTRKGSLLLVHDGYAFRLKNRLAYGKKQWYCTSRTKVGCQVDVTTVLHRLGNLVKRVRNKHNHPPPGFYRRTDGSFKVV